MAPTGQKSLRILTLETLPHITSNLCALVQKLLHKYSTNLDRNSLEQSINTADNGSKQASVPFRAVALWRVV